MKKINTKNNVGSYRILPMLTILIISIIMVSCGGGNSNKQQSGSATTETKQTATAQTVQTTGITKILSLGGLSENDIKPTGFVQSLPFDDDVFVVEVSAPLGEERHKEWVKKIFDKCKQLSTDGKIYRAAYAGNTPSAYEYGDFDKRYSTSTNEWAYPYKGKYISVSVGSLVNKKTCEIGVYENK